MNYISLPINPVKLGRTKPSAGMSNNVVAAYTRPIDEESKSYDASKLTGLMEEHHASSHTRRQSKSKASMRAAISETQLNVIALLDQRRRENHYDNIVRTQFQC